MAPVRKAKASVDASYVDNEDVDQLELADSDDFDDDNEPTAKNVKTAIEPKLAPWADIEAVKHLKCTGCHLLALPAPINDAVLADLSLVLRAHGGPLGRVAHQRKLAACAEKAHAARVANGTVSVKKEKPKTLQQRYG